MNNTFHTLEFDRIVRQLEELACTKSAKEKIRDLEPYLYEGDVRKSQKDTSEARRIIESAGLPPIASMGDVDDILIVIGQDGCLTAEQLESVGMTLTAVKRLKDFLSRCRYLNTGLACYDEELDPLEHVREQLAEAVRGGRVEDGASRLLKSLRQDMIRMEEKVRAKADSILKSKKVCFADHYVTSRNGKMCLPVKKEYRSSVPGSVIDKSATGATLFIEPEAVASLNSELELLKIEEENETRRILYELTAMIAENQEVFEADKRLIEKLDFIFAKGKLSAAMDAKEPQINTERNIRIKNGRHPLMRREEAVPLSFELGERGKGVVITGPNTGGKTVTMKTVGLFCIMAQCGLHVPCEEAVLCMNNLVLCDIGDGQNLSENLSTFSAHITNVLDILKKAGPESLVLLDELGSGTDPAEGMGIAIAILESLRQCGYLFLVTTHYPEVKGYAEAADGIENARMAFDRETLQPLYRLVQGEAGESCALFIAKKLGMPDAMLLRAEQAAYGSLKPERLQEEGGGKKRKNVILPEGPRIRKQKEEKGHQKELAVKYAVGDSVLVLPDKKTGIVCRTVNEKGVLQVQLQDRKIWINHKRIKLQVAAEELYPEGYDFSIIFDTVENRKNRHQMEKRHQEGVEIRMEDD